MSFNNFKSSFSGLDPQHDRIIVQPLNQEKTDAQGNRITAGGIIIPEVVQKEKPLVGIVVAAGPGLKDEPMKFRVGQPVYYGKYTGTEMTWRGVDYLIIRAADIFAAVLEEEYPEAEKGNSDEAKAWPAPEAAEKESVSMHELMSGERPAIGISPAE